MEIRRSSFNFARTEGEGPQSASTQIVFPRRVLRAAVGIGGYSATYENHEDHHLGRLTIELNASVNASDPTRVDVSGAFGLRDWSGDWDDPYGGVVDYVVFAELVGVTPPLPGDARGDLVVADAEITQAIQHFRSHQHLDAANVFPDNSIRLVAGKPAVVRLYVDYDNASGLPPIAQLSGVLQVTAAGTVTTLAPLQSIVPRRDANIERGQLGHTLNFLIPETLCQGAVDIVARVFDAADATQFSGDFARSLLFEPLPSLPIMAVGIQYTGDDVSDPNALAAPTMADFTALFDFTEAVYPIPEVVITSYVTMTYDEDVKSDINDGCDKLGDLKDAVADLRGDADDIVYGLFNSGLDTGSVGGCGGGGVAVGRIGAQGTAAHEVGHALGRKHAPCDNVTRCAQPLDTDGDYPRYSGYDSDSIGEFGFDIRSASVAVKNPANAHDMMGYSGGRWISPYTYKALLSRIPETFGAAAPAGFAAASARSAALPDVRGDWIARKQPQLFLRMDIHRDRSVDFRPAFCFPALPRPHGTEATEFLVELHDAGGNVLRSACLHADGAGCGCNCHAGGWPLRIRHAIAFDPSARKLVLYECDKQIGEWPIPDPPKVSVDVGGNTDRECDDIDVQWHAQGHGDGDDEGLWYLVQWRDRFGTWRGLAPRTQDTRLIVPKRIFKGERRSAIRVLASSGIATGEGGWEGEVHQPGGAPPGGVEIGLVGIDTTRPGAHAVPAVLKATIQSGNGGTLPGAALRWYDSRGGEIARGRSLDLAALRVGQHQITAVAPDTGAGGGSATWLIERTADGRFLLLRGDQKRRGEQPCSEE